MQRHKVATTTWHRDKYTMLSWKKASGHIKTVIIIKIHGAVVQLTQVANSFVFLFNFCYLLLLFWLSRIKNKVNSENCLSTSSTKFFFVCTNTPSYFWWCPFNLNFFLFRSLHFVWKTLLFLWTRMCHKIHKKKKMEKKICQITFI